MKYLNWILDPKFKPCAFVLLLIASCFAIHLLWEAGKKLAKAIQTPHWISCTARYTGISSPDGTQVFPNPSAYTNSTSRSVSVPGTPTVIFTHEGEEQTVELEPPLFSKASGAVQIAYNPDDSFDYRLDGASLRSDLAWTITTGGSIILVSLFISKKLSRHSCPSNKELDQ